MSTLTTFLGLELPELGEYPGTWGTVLNISFQKIDDTLRAAMTAQASAPIDGGPGDPNFIDGGTGSLWYDTAVSLLKIKNTSGNWAPVAYHKHGITEGIPGLHLSNEIDTGTILPSENVQYTGLAAEYLGSGGEDFKWDKYFRVAGPGMEAIGQQIGLLAVPGLAAGDYNLITLDTYGRPTAAQKTNSSVTLGLTDVLTLTAAAANYYNKTDINSIFGFNTLLNGGSQSLKVWADTNYGAKIYEHAEAHDHDDTYAKIDGYSGATPTRQKFAVANLDGSIGTDGDFAMSKAQLDARYLIKDQGVGGLTEDIVTGEVRFQASAYYDPADNIGAGEPASDYELVHKKFVTDWITTVNGSISGSLTEGAADLLYHKRGGGSTLAFDVADPGVNSSGAVPLAKLTSYVSSEFTNHSVTGHPEYETLLSQSAEAVSDHTDISNCIIERPYDDTGYIDYLSYEPKDGSDLYVYFQTPPRTSEAISQLIASCSDGYGGLPGDNDRMLMLSGGEDNLYSTAKIQLSSADYTDNATIAAEYNGQTITITGDFPQSPLTIAFSTTAGANDVDLATGAPRMELVASRLAKEIRDQSSLFADAVDSVVHVEAVKNSGNLTTITVSAGLTTLSSIINSEYNKDYNGNGTLIDSNKLATVPQTLAALSGGADPVDDLHYITVYMDPDDPLRISKIGYLSGAQLPVVSVAPPVSPSPGDYWYNANSKALWEWKLHIDEIDNASTGVYDWRAAWMVPIASFTSITGGTINGLTYIDVDAGAIFAGGVQDPGAFAFKADLAAIESAGAKIKIPGAAGNLATLTASGNLGDSGVQVVDEDNMASNSAALIPTQQSVKAYVDNHNKPYDINGFVVGVPPISSLLFKMVAVREFIIGTVHHANVGTNPSAQTDFDIQVNSVSKSTLQVGTNGIGVFNNNGLDALTISIGDIIEVYSPANLNGLTDLAFALNANC